MSGRTILIAVTWLLSIAAGARGQTQQPAAAPPAHFAPAIQEASRMPRLYSLLVSQSGTVLLEQYYNGARATRPTNIKSAAKSVISALVGIAIDRRLLPGVTAPIGTYFSDLLRAPSDLVKREITIEDLLTMRSGLETTSNRNYGAWVKSPNWVRFVLTRELIVPAGTMMDYSTGNTHLLSAILTKATGRSTWQFAQETLAKPLGFTLAPWTRDPQGVFFGGNEMLMTPRQMLAFGELYLNRGRANTKQVVPSPWIDQSFIPRGRSQRGDMDGRQYGYGWWMRDLAGHQTYYAWGYGGQFIFVVPDLELVIVTTSSTASGEERRGHRRTVTDLVEQLIIAPMASPISTPIRLQDR